MDGDGIPYRTVPGDGMPAYFTRGSGHNEKAQYSERADDYANNLDRLARKFETARTLVPKPEVEMAGEGGIGLIAYGTTHWAIVESRDQLKNEQEIDTSYLRLRAYPFTHGGRRLHRSLRPRLRGGAEPRRPDAVAAQDGMHTRSSSPSCAASAITSGCRSTAGR